MSIGDDILKAVQDAGGAIVTDTDNLPSQWWTAGEFAKHWTVAELDGFEESRGGGYRRNDEVENEYEEEVNGEMVTMTVVENNGAETTILPAADPERGLPRLAYLGAHAGFIMEPGIKYQNLDSLKNWLCDVGFNGTFATEALAAVGLTCCEDWDCGDDGGYWLIQDEEKFAAFYRICQVRDVLADSDDEVDVTAEVEALLSEPLILADWLDERGNHAAAGDLREQFTEPEQTTYQVGDKNCPEHIRVQLERIEEAAGDYADGNIHPCGLVASYRRGEELPWRIADDWASEEFATAAEAVAGAAEWVKAMNADMAAEQQRLENERKFAAMEGIE